MSNMSYCLFQNTLEELLKCEARMSELADGKPLSEAEDRAKNRMIEVCQNIIDIQESIDNDKECPLNGPCDHDDCHTCPHV